MFKNKFLNNKLLIFTFNSLSNRRILFLKSVTRKTQSTNAKEEFNFGQINLRIFLCQLYGFELSSFILLVIFL